MIEVGAYDAKTKLSELLKQVQAGESFLITKHHVPIARLIPSRAEDQRPLEETLQEVLRFRKGKSLRGLVLKTLIEEGRQ